MSIPFLDLRAAGAELERELSGAAARVIAGGRFVLGPEVEAFEAEFAALCGTRHCVGVGSGLDALHFLLRARGIGPGDEVVVPAYTAVATWMAVAASGARPVGADADPATYAIDTAAVEAAITPRTAAIVVVHLFGIPVELGELAALAQHRGLALLEDAAHAHGARGPRGAAGAMADGGAFSFYPTKNLGALGDGGCVTTHDEALASEVRKIRDNGWRVRGHAERLGFSSRLDELQAALLRVKLPRLAGWNARRAALAARYSEALAGLEEVQLPRSPAGAEAVWHLFVAGVERRDEVRRRLVERGVGSLVHYDPLPPLTDAFAPEGPRAGEFPHAERLSRRALSLPLHPHLSDSAADRVAAALHGALGAAPSRAAGALR